jgi:hypothetical protein
VIEFDTEIVRLPGKMAWPVFYIPASFTADTRGRINVRAVVDGAEFHGTLLPSSKGHYLVYSQAMRKHCKKEIGGSVHVLLEVDNQPREVELPHDIAAALAGSPAALVKFTSLAYYLRREEINKINDAKTLPTREKRIHALIDKLLK